MKKKIFLAYCSTSFCPLKLLLILELHIIYKISGFELTKNLEITKIMNLEKVFHLHLGIQRSWCSGYHCGTTSINIIWSQLPPRFKTWSRKAEDLQWWNLWQWSRLKIRLNTFRWSTISQPQFIIVTNACMLLKHCRSSLRSTKSLVKVAKIMSSSVSSSDHVTQEFFRYK